MKELLANHQGVVELIFGCGLVVGLIYAIYSSDKVTTAAIIGGILGYMKGRNEVQP